MIYRERKADVHQEKDEVPMRRLLLVGFAAIGLSAILVILSWMLLEQRIGVLRPSRDFPESRLTAQREVVMIQQELFSDRGPGQLLDSERRKALESFSWADRAQNRVNIPIEDAMSLVIEESRKPEEARPQEPGRPEERPGDQRPQEAAPAQDERPEGAPAPEGQR